MLTTNELQEFEEKLVTRKEQIKKNLEDAYGMIAPGMGARAGYPILLRGYVKPGRASQMPGDTFNPCRP